jgi:hypothetical protein
MSMIIDGSAGVTFPNSSVQPIAANSGPAFSAYASGGQSLSAGVETKIQFNNKDFDTNTCYSTSNYRFTPNVAGYYQITVGISVQSFSSYIEPIIYKNGSVWMYGPYPIISVSSTNWNYLTGLVYCNGSTDYIEAYVLAGASATTQTNNYYKFQGVLVRSA